MVEIAAVAAGITAIKNSVDLFRGLAEKNKLSKEELALAKEGLIIAADRLALAREQLSAVVDDHNKLVNKVAELQQKADKLEKEIASYRAANEFVDKGIVAFKRTAGGSIGETAYCPICRLVMSNPFPGEVPFLCPNCKHTVDSDEVSRLYVKALTEG